MVLHTKELKIRKVKGNEDIVAGSAGVPVNVFVVDCQPKECSVTPIVDELGELVEFNMKGLHQLLFPISQCTNILRLVCPFQKILQSKKQIITKNRNALVKAEGAFCNGFTFVVSLEEKSYKYNLPCPHSITMSVENGVLNRRTGYFNGTDFLCEILKANIVVNPIVSIKRPPRVLVFALFLSWFKRPPRVLVYAFFLSWFKRPPRVLVFALFSSWFKRPPRVLEYAVGCAWRDTNRCC
jgi:hypothetical protein